MTRRTAIEAPSTPHQRGSDAQMLPLFLFRYEPSYSIRITTLGTRGETIHPLRQQATTHERWRNLDGDDR